MQKKVENRKLLIVGFMLLICTTHALENAIFFIEGGAELMYYYVTFEVGSHGERQSAIVDTGSDTLAFPCDRCSSSDCGTHADPRFTTSKSSSFTPVLTCSSSQLNSEKYCTFEKRYLEGSSISGFLAEDYFTFKSRQRNRRTQLSDIPASLMSDLKIKSEFGCTTKETGLFITQYADGIMGLDNNSSFIKSIERNHNGKVFSFGFCFHQEGGVMVADLRMPDNTKYTMVGKKDTEFAWRVELPYKAHRGWFEVELDTIAVNGHSFTVGKIPFMVDTGSTYTVMPEDVLKEILVGINLHCQTHPKNCGSIKNGKIDRDTCIYLSSSDHDFKDIEEAMHTFPDVKLHFPGHKQPLLLKPHNYFMVDKKSNSACFSLTSDRNTERITWGAFNMINNIVYIDRVTKKLVIVPENCVVLTGEMKENRRRLSLIQEPESLRPIQTVVHLGEEEAKEGWYLRAVMGGLLWCVAALLVVSLPVGAVLKMQGYAQSLRPKPE